jgi:hypothetical protein
MCDEVAWLDHGELLAVGEPGRVVLDYLQTVNDAESERLRSSVRPTASVTGADQRRGGTGEIEITSVEFRDTRGGRIEAARSGDPLVIRLSFVAHEPVDGPVFALSIHGESGIEIAGPASPLAEDVVQGRGIADYGIPRLGLLPGTYQLTAAVLDRQGVHPYDVREHAFTLHVQPGANTQTDGLVDLGGRWVVKAQLPATRTDKPIAGIA